jgi:hypothetical protein
LVIYAAVMWFLVESRTMPCATSESLGITLIISIAIMCMIMFIGAIIEQRWIYLLIPPVSWYISTWFVVAFIH